MARTEVTSGSRKATAFSCRRDEDGTGETGRVRLGVVALLSSSKGDNMCGIILRSEIVAVVPIVEQNCPNAFAVVHNISRIADEQLMRSSDRHARAA